MYDTGQQPSRSEPGKPEEGGGGAKVWYIAIGLVVLVAGGLFIFKARKPGPPAVAAQAVKPDTTARKPVMAVAENPRQGIGIGRNAIEQVLAEKPYFFTFRESGVVNRESNYLGTSLKLPRATIQLLGRPDDISEAAYIDVIPHVTPPNPHPAPDTAVSLPRPRGAARTPASPEYAWSIVMESTARKFTLAIDSNAIDWVNEMLTKIWMKKGAFATKEIDHRLWTISYSRLGEDGHFLIRSTLPKSAEASHDAALKPR
ncbi:MAG: hypothetical protein JWQ98_1807 [Chlorobi bacterium]|nr:hypothetical protein [Chlorobiota bacterium]